MQVLKGTITSLEDIRKDDASIASQIQASIEILSSKGVDAHGEFSRLHRPRRRPHRLDENADTAADISMVAFYEKEFKAVLDTLIQQYKENMKACLKKVKALSIVLQPPLSPNHNDADLKELLGLFPKHLTKLHLLLNLKFSSMWLILLKEIPRPAQLSCHWQMLQQKLKKESTFFL